MSNYEEWQLATFGNILPEKKPILSDEREQSEIDQERLDRDYQLYEFEMEDH